MRCLIFAFVLLLVAACDSTPTPETGGFISDVYGQSTGSTGGGADAGAAQAPGAEPGDRSGDGGGERAIAEADIIQIDGDKLYALSTYAGMTIVDLANPADLRVLGRYRFSATPFEMYLREGVAYVMYNGYYTFAVDEATGQGSWQTTARLQALDVSDPANIRLLADEQVPGLVSDSRMVGDVIYLATFENGYCWGCDAQPKSRVASFRVSSAGFSAIDDLAFDAGRDWGPQSIAVTTERIYVASNDWSRAWNPSMGDEGNRLFTVDISDPAGDLVPGATIRVHGRINSRWQMDEHEGVLRVISQAGGWGSGEEPVVETFAVTSSQEVTPLASLNVRLPRPETLQSVRFDGDRAYAITFERVDPLFTFDLSDPAAPKQVGELEIPGWVYHMEPRGDRIYGLGFQDGSMTVSIFDVSDLATPTMLDRVLFGGDWSWAVEDQDRIHKAFNLLLDQGLILVPFAGSTSDEDRCSWEWQSGIQIIDVAGDTLSLRGAAPQIGTARRSILRGTTLFGVSDHSVQSFDITDRDNPQTLDALEVARQVSSVHAVSDDEVLRFGNDWWTRRTMLDMTRPEEAETAEPMAELDLAEIEANSYSCGSSSSWGSTIYPHGRYVYAPHYRYDHTEGSSTVQLTIHVVDLEGPQPSVVGQVALPQLVQRYDGAGYESFGEILKTDSALLISRVRGYWNPNGDSEQQVTYDVYSLADPARPAASGSYALPREIARGWGYFPGGCSIDFGYGWWYGYGYGASGRAMVSGDIVASQHAVRLTDGTNRVRYYLDRLDVSDPSAPRMLPPINIPGQVVSYDGASDVVVTLEDVLRVESMFRDWSDCAALGARVSMGSDGMCQVWSRRLNTLRLERNVALLVSRESLDDDRFFTTDVAVTASRVFARRTEAGVRWDGSTVPAAEVLTFDLGADGRLSKRPALSLSEMQPGYWWGGGIRARGDHAFISESNRLFVIDASAAGAPTQRSVDMPGWYCQSLEARGDRAYCAMGPHGVLTIDL